MCDPAPPNLRQSAVRQERSSGINEREDRPDALAKTPATASFQQHHPLGGFRNATIEFPERSSDAERFLYILRHMAAAALVMVAISLMRGWGQIPAEN
jgi:hypothetical protein